MAPSDTFGAALADPNSAVTIEYLKAGLSGLRIAPSAFGTAALALPVAMKAAQLEVDFRLFIAGAALALVGVFGLSWSAYHSAVQGSDRWAKRRLFFLSLLPTVLAAGVLLCGVWLGTKST